LTVLKLSTFFTMNKKSGVM